MISQKNNVIGAVSIISLTGYNIIWYACDERKIFFHSDLRVVLVCAVTSSLERFTFFLLGLSDLDDSSIFIFLNIFQKIRKCLKMLFQKIKPIISSSFSYKKLSKNYQKIIKINIAKLFI